MTKPDWRTIGLGLLEIALLGTALVSIATLFDEQHRYLELFSHFRLQYFAASLLLLIVFVGLRWRTYALIGIAATAVNGWLIVPWYLPAEDRPAASGTGEAIVVMSANVLASNARGDGLIDLVRETGPDLLVVQEVTPAWAKALVALHPAYPYRVVEPRDDPFGTALFSKFPLESSAVVGSVPLGVPDVVATAIIGGARLGIISAHTIPPLGEVNYGARNLHLDSLATLAARTPKPLVVIGDLNVTMWSVHYRRLEETGGLVNARRGFGIVPSWPTFLLPAMIPIDHVLVSPDIGVTDFRAGPGINSDHLPIIAKLLVPGTAGR